MNAISIRTISLGFMKFLAFAAAWALILIALMFSLFPLYSPWIRIVFAMLPAVLIASGLIKWSLSAKPDKKSSPLSLCVTLACIILLMFASLVFVRAGGMTPFEKGIKHIFQMKRSPAIGLMADNNLRNRLFMDGIKLDLLTIFKTSEPAGILNYRVSSYELSSTRMLFNEIFINQEYFFVSDSPRPFIIDCGSHIGMSILYAKSLYPNARVIGFEPAPGTFRLLSENVRQNGLKDVTLINKAVGGQEGMMKFYGDDTMTASLLDSRNSGKATEVPVVKLSQYIDRPVDFFKLDVEGAEGPVMEDLAATAKMQMIKIMTIEYHHHIEKNSDALSKFLKLLEDNNFGYQVEAAAETPHTNGSYQDIMIFAYHK
jgi:FkbM family methyltransferase